MLVMHFGHPVPEMHSHDATSCGAAIRPASATTSHDVGRHGSHHDLTARCVGCCARRRAPIAGSSPRGFAPSMARQGSAARAACGPLAAPGRARTGAGAARAPGGVKSAPGLRNRHSVPFRAAYSSADSSAFNRLSSCLRRRSAQPREAWATGKRSMTTRAWGRTS
jgi:hypothetical protein